jgi:hypothetical protein
VSLISISSGGSFFSITFSAVYRSALIGFEWNLTFLSTFSADRIMHFSWSTIRHSFRTSNSLKELVSLKHQFWKGYHIVTYKLVYKHLHADLCLPLIQTHLIEPTAFLGVRFFMQQCKKLKTPKTALRAQPTSGNLHKALIIYRF